MHETSTHTLRTALLACGLFALAPGLLSGQGLGNLTPQIPVSNPYCPYFGKQAEGTVSQSAAMGSGAQSRRGSGGAQYLSHLTGQVMNALPPVPGGGRTAGAIDLSNAGIIDSYIFSALQSAGVQPADSTTDWEFIRRVTLDLTGRMPSPADVTAFVNDSTPGKRATLVNRLMGSSPWIDKWTMYFGDLFKNNSSNAQINRYRPGVQAFYNYIKASLAANKPYNQIATDLITAQGDTSYTTGTIGYNVGGVVTGGPVQDVWDQQLANVADTFLGIAHQNCILCHNGAGHLTGLSLWGAQQTRVNAWGMAAFFAHTNTFSTAVSADSATPRYWTVVDGATKAYTGDYALNTTTGNRPPRQPLGTLTTISPAYIFTGEKPHAGENYRSALARMIVADPQFARATVNYMWAYFFGVGLVDPPDQFDPLRLDPDNPPPASSGYSLQPSNPRLLNALTQAFIASNFDLQWLQKQIVNSQAYQFPHAMTERGTMRGLRCMRASWFAGFGVKRFTTRWLHRAMYFRVTTSPHTGRSRLRCSSPNRLTFLMAPTAMSNNFLDAFLRGNRDDQPRSESGSILQTLNLMNDSLVMSRVSPTGPSGSLLAPISVCRTPRW